VVGERADGVVPRRVAVVVAGFVAAAAAAASAQDQLVVVERQPDAVVDRQERRDAVAAARRPPEPDPPADAFRLEGRAAGHRHVEPQLVQRVRATAPDVAAKPTSQVAEDRLERVRVRVPCAIVSHRISYHIAAFIVCAYYDA